MFRRTSTFKNGETNAQWGKAIQTARQGFNLKLAVKHTRDISFLDWIAETLLMNTSQVTQLARYGLKYEASSETHVPPTKHF